MMKAPSFWGSWLPSDRLDIIKWCYMIMSKRARKLDKEAVCSRPMICAVDVTLIFRTFLSCCSASCARIGRDYGKEERQRAISSGEKGDACVRRSGGEEVGPDA